MTFWKPQSTGPRLLRQLTMAGQTFDLYYGPGVTQAQAEYAAESAKLLQYVEKATAGNLNISRVTLNWVFAFRENILFLNATVAHNQPTSPAVVFIRGDSVAVLLVLTEQETRAKYVVLVEQPRVPAGQAAMLELIAGMTDGAKILTGPVGTEIAQETGIIADLTHAVQLGRASGIYPSPGGCDERVTFWLVEKSLTAQEMEAIQGRVAGNLEEGESIRVRVVPLSEMLSVAGQDMKVLTAWALYAQYLGMQLPN